MFAYRFEGAKSEFLGPTSGKRGELPLEGVFQNGCQNTNNWHIKVHKGQQWIYFYENLTILRSQLFQKARHFK